VVLGFGAVVFLGLDAVLDALERGALYVAEERLVVLGLLSDELVDLVVVVDEAVEVLVFPALVLFELPAFGFEDVEVLVPLDSDRSFLSALILYALTPARVASTGAAKILITDATNIAQKKDALDGLYPRRRGMLIDVR